MQLISSLNPAHSQGSISNAPASPSSIDPQHLIRTGTREKRLRKIVRPPQNIEEYFEPEVDCPDYTTRVDGWLSTVNGNISPLLVLICIVFALNALSFIAGTFMSRKFACHHCCTYLFLGICGALSLLLCKHD